MKAIKNNRKRRSICIALITAIICLFSCTAVWAEDAEATPFDKAPATEVQEASDTGIDDNWKEHPQISIDGVIYDLPLSIRKLVDNGWYVLKNDELSLGADGEEIIVEPGTYFRGDIALVNDKYNTSEDTYRYANFCIILNLIYNDTKEAKPIEDCYAKVIEMDTHITDDTLYEAYPSILLAHGLTFGSPMDYITKTMGDPVFSTYGMWSESFALTYTNELDEGFETADYYTSYELQVYEEGGIGKIQLIHDFLQVDEEEPVQENTEAPETEETPAETSAEPQETDSAETQQESEQVQTSSGRNSVITPFDSIEQ